MSKFTETAYAAVDVAAAAWKRRARVYDLAGAACIVYGLSLITAWAAWLAAGVWLMVQALGSDRRVKS